jgi:hypothetical protein
MAKKKVGYPWEEQKIYVTNGLRKAVHVMIMPNPDYVFADILVSFVGMGSSVISIVKTASDLVRLIRILRLLRNAREIIDKLNQAIPGSSVRIPPGGRVEVYNAWFSDKERFLKPASTIFEMFGGQTRTLIVMDEDFKNTVKFDTAVNKNYTVNETGVEPPMHYWNGGHIISGLLSSANPSVVRMGDEMLMAYRDSKGQRIYLAELKEGYWNHKDRGWVNNDSEEAIAVTLLDGKLALVGRENRRDQMFSLWQSDKPLPLDAPLTFMGPDIQAKPSVTTLGDTMYAVAKHFPGNAVMWSSRRTDGRIEWGNTMLTTWHSPSIQAFKGKLYLFYTESNKMLHMAVYNNATKKWDPVSVWLSATSAQVALTIYKDRMYVFYRDAVGNGVFYMWTNDGSNFLEAPDRYFAFDYVASDPTAAAMPGDTGILVAGILKSEKKPSDLIDPTKDEAIIWTILNPYEPLLTRGGKNKARLVTGPRKAAKKSASKKVGAKKPAAKKAVKSKGKTTTARKGSTAKTSKKSVKRPTAAAKRKK